MALYARITEIVHNPISPEPGDTVWVAIVLKNIGSSTRKMWPAITRWNDNIFHVDSNGLMQVTLAPGESRGWGGTFIMPNKNVEVYVESWYEGDNGLWGTDDNQVYGIPLPGGNFANMQVLSVTSPVDHGETCIIVTRFQHIGKGGTWPVRAAIGIAGATFNEILWGQLDIIVPEHITWTAVITEIPILITASINDGVYDVYAKVGAPFPALISPFYQDIVNVGAVDPVNKWYSLFQGNLSVDMLSSGSTPGWISLFLGNLSVEMLAAGNTPGWTSLVEGNLVVTIPKPPGSGGASIGGIILVGGAAALAALALKRGNA